MKFALTEQEMATLKTGTLIDRIRVFRNATNWNLKMSKDACEAIMSGRMKIEEFFMPKSPCPHCDGTGFVSPDNSEAMSQPINHEEAEQLAHLKMEESNLARCYLDIQLQVEELQKKLDALEHRGQHMTCGPCEQLREQQKRNDKPECNCLVPVMEGAGQHSPSCAIFKGRVEHCYGYGAYCHVISMGSTACNCICAKCKDAKARDH